MSDDDARLMVDRHYLQTVQYRTAANLAARQSIYQFQHPHIDLAAAAVDLARLDGSQTVADVGCGNGLYLAELARRGHCGRMLGVDLSIGMLQAARAGASAAGAVHVGSAAGDAAALPLADAVADVTLAMHMLYHVPDKRAAVRELRRVTRDGGQVIVALNGSDHLQEFDELVPAAAQQARLSLTNWAGRNGQELGLNMDVGADLLADEFSSIERHDFVAELQVPRAGPVLDYVASMRITQSLTDPDALVRAVARQLPGGTVTIRTHSGVLICR